jgi:SAM-dependent methyltransferase
MENREVFGLAPTQYRAFRPGYPAELFEYLASLCPSPVRALDCATGNGQAAVGLAERFERVAAFDASAAQIESAIPHERVEYRVGPAESPPFDECFDLVTIAQAAHWFDLPAFYDALTPTTHEATIVAVGGYTYSTVEPRVDACVAEVLAPRLDPYWAEGNRMVLERYSTIPFPFRELDWPRFVSRCVWTLDAYMSYLRTWSAVKLFERAHGHDPVAELQAVLAEFWKPGEMKPIEFELVGRVGRRS